MAMDGDSSKTDRDPRRGSEILKLRFWQILVYEVRSQRGEPSDEKPMNQLFVTHRFS